jgi:hypothetical protein
LIEPVPRSNAWTVERDTPARSASVCWVRRKAILRSAKTRPMRAISGVGASDRRRVRLGPATPAPYD